MKKTILTICAAVGISAVAFGQGSLNMQDNSTLGGVNTNTANVNGSGPGGGWYTGTLTVEMFAVQSNSPSQWTSVQADVATINALSASPSTALSDLIGDGWVQQTIGGLSSIAPSVSGGDFSVGIETIGTSGTLPTSSTTSLVNTIYAIYGAGAGGIEGVLVFNPSNSGAPAPGTPVNDEYTWPAQNLLLTPVPEPATLAIAALGGLSLLGLRRRKA